MRGAVYIYGYWGRFQLAMGEGQGQLIVGPLLMAEAARQGASITSLPALPTDLQPPPDVTPVVVILVVVIKLIINQSHQLTV